MVNQNAKANGITEKDLEDCFEYLYYKNSEVVNVGALK